MRDCSESARSVWSVSCEEIADTLSSSAISIAPASQLAPAVSLQPITAEPPGLGARAVMSQNWTDLGYFHWRYPPAVVQALLPRGVVVDTFDGSAWVGLIPFVMRNVRIGPLPEVPFLSTFVEVNVRTYVVDEQGRRSVWFFSLDVPRAMIVAIARSVFSLPYCWGQAVHTHTDNRHHYSVVRRWPHRGPGCEIGYSQGELLTPAQLTELDHFLTARWSLVTTRSDTVLRGRIHHPQWPLHDVHDVSLAGNLVEAAGLPAPAGVPHSRCSPGVPVTVAWLQHV